MLEFHILSFVFRCHKLAMRFESLFYHFDIRYSFALWSFQLLGPENGIDTSDLVSKVLLHKGFHSVFRIKL